ncbi:hypothetical protein TFUB22_01087 [Tannerella forsythia]|nr:hypothetical protein TFUB22_01087 [Tannerella forsythia]
MQTFLYGRMLEITYLCGAYFNKSNSIMDFYNERSTNISSYHNPVD